MKFFIIGLIVLIFSPIIILCITFSGAVVAATWKLILSMVGCTLFVCAIGALVYWIYKMLK